MLKFTETFLNDFRQYSSTKLVPASTSLQEIKKLNQVDLNKKILSTFSASLRGFNQDELQTLMVECEITFFKYIAARGDTAFYASLLKHDLKTKYLDIEKTSRGLA